MGCCSFDLREKLVYQIVAKVKNQHRTKNFSDKIKCMDCGGILEHEMVRKNRIGFSVNIKCQKCGWEFEG